MTAGAAAVERGGERAGGLLASPWVLPALFVAVALALKASTLGDLNRHVDETFYFLVGQGMHEGLLPYVDVWDRKPLGLFLLYYLFAGISSSVLSYQVAACLFTGATAWIVALIVRRWTGSGGAVFAGLAYLVMLDPFEGNVGQAADFYNLFVAAAAWLLLREQAALAEGRTGPRLWAAMLLCGMAITIKQTALFESLFFGLWALAALIRAKVPAGRILCTALICAAIGMAPMAAIAAFYALAGHWAEFWHAMVLSNLAKGRVGGEAWQAVGVFMRAVVLAGIALAGLWSRRGTAEGAFVAGWLAAALIGFVAIPNFYGHYFLPVVTPLAVAAGAMFGLRKGGLLIFTGFLVYGLVWNEPWKAESTRESKRTMAQVAALVRQHDAGRGLLIYDGAQYIYVVSGKPFLSPLVFPQHLNHEVERNVSHLDTNHEIDRILAQRPGVVVMTRYPTYLPVNRYTRRRVLDYVHARCRLVGAVQVSSNFAYNPHLVFGDCGIKKPA